MYLIVFVIRYIKKTEEYQPILADSELLFFLSFLMDTLTVIQFNSETFLNCIKML